MGLLQRINPFRKTAKKSWFNFSGAENYRNDPQWFQKGYGPPNGDGVLDVSTVYACIKIISEEMARLNIEHGKENSDGAITFTKQSAPALVLRNPNSYQTRSDFILNLMLNLLKEGNAYSLAKFDRRGAVSELHPLPSRGCTPYVVRETGEIFYHFSSFDVTGMEDGTMVPQRYILHNRLFTPTHPLIGQTPLVAAAMSMATHENINGQSGQFFANMSRPDGILTTPKPLALQAAQRLKEMWESRAAGKTPVLDNDIKYQPLTMTAVDSEIIKQFNLSLRQIANVFRIPLDFLGEIEKGTYANAEQMQKRFILSTLGFYLEHLETAFDKFFGLPATEGIKFDLESGMMRPDFGDRMEALGKGVTTAVLTPNEARRKENLPPIDGGDDAYLQRQNWPLGMLGEDANPATGTGASNGDTDSVSDNPNDVDEPDAERGLNIVDIREHLRSIVEEKKRA